MAKDAKKKVTKKEVAKPKAKKEKKAKRPGDEYVVKFSFTNKEGGVEEFENTLTAKRMLQAVNTTLREAKQDTLKSRKIKNLKLEVNLADEEIEDISDKGVEVK